MASLVLPDVHLGVKLLSHLSPSSENRDPILHSRKADSNSSVASGSDVNAGVWEKGKTLAVSDLILSVHPMLTKVEHTPYG
jgi:hypothetical protein